MTSALFNISSPLDMPGSKTMHSSFEMLIKRPFFKYLIFNESIDWIVFRLVKLHFGSDLIQLELQRRIANVTIEHEFSKFFC